MDNEINVKTLDEFDKMIEAKDFKIAQIIVNSVMSNIKNRKKNIHIISINCKSDETTYDLTLERQHFKSTLEENLQHFEDRELYEECAKIKECIDSLN